MTTDTIVVPLSLWQKIIEVLSERTTVSDGEDEDNDYAVCDLLDEMREIK